MSIYSQCFQENAQGNKFSKHCWYIRFPNHPFKQQRKECGTLLLLQKHEPSSKKGTVSIITYLFGRNHFMSVVKNGDRVVPDGLMGDVYDVNRWKNYRGNLLWKILTALHSCALLTWTA